MTTVISAEESGPATGRTFRLSPRVRKITLIAHIAVSGAWLGIEVVLGVLVVTALGASEQDAAILSVGITAFANWPLIVVGVASLGTGVVLGLGSGFGLVRYRWVVIKLVLNLVLLILVFVLLMPGVAELGASATAAIDGDGSLSLDGQLLYPPIVSSTVLVFAMTLGVFKPWGRVLGKSR